MLGNPSLEEAITDAWGLDSQIDSVTRGVLEFGLAPADAASALLGTAIVAGIKFGILDLTISQFPAEHSSALLAKASACRGSEADLRTVAASAASMTPDQISNALIGINEILNLRFNELWREFETRFASLYQRPDPDAC